MAEQTVTDRTIAGQYSGLTDRDSHGRGVSNCEYHWNRESHAGTFDELLMQQLEGALANGRTQVNVVDVGSGDAGLFSSFLQDGPSGSQTREFLAKHPEMRLNMVGLTDSPSTDRFLKEQDIVLQKSNDDLDNSQIQARNVYYTLSVNQTLEAFLQSQQINQADLILSTWALTYLGPNSFRGVMEDVVQSLRPNGGRFVGVAYAEKETPGFKSISPGFPHIFVDKGVDDGVASVQSTLTDSMRFFRRGVDMEIELENLRKSEQVMMRLGVLSQEEIDIAEREFQENVIAWGKDDMYAALSTRYATTIAQKVELLAVRKQAEMKERKTQILSECN